MPIFDGKYDYGAAGHFDHFYTQVAANLQTPEFIDLAKVFVASTNRLRAFFELPLQLIFWSAAIGQVKLLGRHHMGIDPEDDSRDGEPEVNQSIIDTYNRFVTNPSADRLLAFSSDILGSMTGDQGGAKIDAAAQGVEASFAAMIMTAYATFETLAADLWVCALNRHISLATNWAEKNQGKQLTMQDIYSRGGDLSKSSGTALHQTRKVSFESLKEIRGAYSHAYKNDLDSIFAVPDLSKAEKIRHLFAHRGGLVDKKFKDDMSDFADCKDVVIGDRLRLTGPSTGELLNACVSAGCHLLLKADHWSKTHL
jgi:hypothetical protein